MRQHAGTANRVWLTILALLCLAAGVYLLLLASGVVGTPGNPVLSGPPEDVTGASYAPGAVLIGGLVLGTLGLWWMFAQVPRRVEAGTFRLQENPARGVTVCDPSVLAAAVEDDTERIAGVVDSTALLRGTAGEPDLTLKVTVNSWADIGEVMDQIEGAVVPHLAMALENPLRSLGVQLEASNKPAVSGGPVSTGGTVVY